MRVSAVFFVVGRVLVEGRESVMCIVEFWSAWGDIRRVILGVFFFEIGR